MNGWNVWDSKKWEELGRILAFEKLQLFTQVAKLTCREGTGYNPKKPGLGERLLLILPGMESRLDSKAQISCSHWKVNSIQLFQEQFLLFVHAQNTFAKALQSA